MSRSRSSARISQRRPSGKEQIDADRHAFCHAICNAIGGHEWEEVHCHYTETSRAAGSGPRPPPFEGALQGFGRVTLEGLPFKNPLEGNPSRESGLQAAGARTHAHCVWSTALNRGHNSTRRPQRRKEKNDICGGWKKRENWSSPPFGTPPFWPPLFLGLLQPPHQKLHQRHRLPKKKKRKRKTQGHRRPKRKEKKKKRNKMHAIEVPQVQMWCCCLSKLSARAYGCAQHQWR